MKKHLLVSVAFTLLLIQTGCLKTRAQLKEDGNDEAARPVQSKIQEVQPQGEYVIDELKSEITRLTGRIEDLERSQKQQSEVAASANKDELKKLEARVTELEQAQAQMLEALKKVQDASAAATATDPVELFDKGKAQFEAGNFEGAIESLGAYLKAPKAKVAVERATFLRGEAYYQLKQYKKAIVDYSKFPEKFTKSTHMPVALYKIGLCFEALGMKDDARSFYQELVDKYPKSPEARRVKAKLR